MFADRFVGSVFHNSLDYMRAQMRGWTMEFVPLLPASRRETPAKCRALRGAWEAFLFHRRRNLSDSRAAVIPTLQNREMLHRLKRGVRHGRRQASSACCTRDSIDCDFVCSGTKSRTSPDWQCTRRQSGRVRPNLFRRKAARSVHSADRNDARFSGSWPSTGFSFSNVRAGPSVFEFKIGGRVVAQVRDFPHQRLAAAVEVGLHTRHFRAVLIIATTFETGCQAHLHFGIDAARKRRVGVQVVHATAHLEEVEGVIGEFLGCYTGLKRTVIKDRPFLRPSRVVIEARGYSLSRCSLTSGANRSAQTVRVSFRGTPCETW